MGLNQHSTATRRPLSPPSSSPRPPSSSSSYSSTTASLPFCRIILLSPVLLITFFLLFSSGRNTTIFSPAGLPCSFTPAFKTPHNWTGDLRFAQFAWNKLCFGQTRERLRLAVFSKKWPVGSAPGGMERHAHTLYSALARAGHTVHVYTVAAIGKSGSRRVDHIVDGELHLHLASNDAGMLDVSTAWKLFVAENRSQPFHFVHTESVALPHWRARLVPNLAATWHGIAYEGLHSELFQDLLRGPREPRSDRDDGRLRDALPKLLDEVRFFSGYRHHIAISDSAGQVLVNVYQLPKENVHIILNGVDHDSFHHDPEAGARFRLEFGVPHDAGLVMGVAGRLVKDKGHPLLYEAFSAIKERHPHVYLLIAGAGPWEKRYRELEPNVKVLGAMDPSRLAEFYNALDVFVNPTLRPQGLDLTLMEAMHCGKPLLATNFPSIAGTVVLNDGFGYTFAPNVKSLTEAMESAIRDGPEELARKGEGCKQYAMAMFTSRKMASAYERFFLCMKDVKYCQYPLDIDHC
ncbi:uncharacterized protein LOC116260968 [Nymphaea colorata]|nr:uncharacterized protein LOC116260968 [Nymphaea colorata]